MKKFSAIIIMAFVLLNTISHAQTQSGRGFQATSIEPYPLQITYNKTSNIIFPYNIVSVDKGSKDVLVQKAKGVENILQIKAAKENFAETNLSVVTADGKLRSFVINYAAQPSVLNVSFANNENSNSLFLSSANINQAEVAQNARTVYVSKKNIRGIKGEHFGICFSMNGLFIQGNIMYLRLIVENKSNIDYDIDQLRFFIRDQQKAKRTATQEIEITPLYKQNNVDKVAGQSSETIVVAVAKFTIPDKKYLAIQLMEKSGGRCMELRMKNNKIVKAVSIE